jgi:cleavage and polyadenylation specificity factor subunit 1
MHAVYEEILPPSGVEFAAFVQLTNPTNNTHAEQSTRAFEPTCDLVVARRNLLQVYNVVKWMVEDNVRTWHLPQ